MSGWGVKPIWDDPLLYVLGFPVFLVKKGVSEIVKSLGMTHQGSGCRP